MLHRIHPPGVLGRGFLREPANPGPISGHVHGF